MSLEIPTYPKPEPEQKRIPVSQSKDAQVKPRSVRIKAAPQHPLLRGRRDPRDVKYY